MIPYHDGERAVQQRAGEQVAALRNARIVSTEIPAGVAEFLTAQPMCIVTSADAAGRIWISPLQGEPGLLRPIGPARVAIDLTRVVKQEGDPLWRNLHAESMAGVLVIELSTRRRFRINGRVRSFEDNQIVIDVAQAYPNCTKYIQRRRIRSRTGERRLAAGTQGVGVDLGPEQAALIRAADTVFVGSLHPEAGADASHRGGPPGFVQILGPRTLRISDFPGNGMFNTLGNISVHPRAALLVIDFDRHTSLQVTGRAEIHWQPEPGLPGSAETGRCWDLHIERWLHESLPVLWEWERLDP
jgi:predicted pyridoxine 5'-phosphate oxidase superfamily flavin-nucleotide-binding protein